ncbi:hypothetical protein EXIGLDRAFT_737612 [Exidia glandulosa HHB12029]|uniref:Uncharacterized protein n=1 Tax=Exidia glandulosa HHB12029 TaxID=1314781 RepID=A0A166MWC8_EXIGL|nr:hypothetical protein EXIGLDRAFT_737612 [Exidia glandulosa HHB12029]
MSGLAVIALLAAAALVHADTVPGSSPAWAVNGLRQLNPIDNCISVPDGEGLFLVQPDFAELTFQGTGMTVQGGGGIALFTLDGAQNISSRDTGADECVQLASWSGLDPGAQHVLRVEAQESNRAVAIAQVLIDGGTASTTPPPPTTTTEPPGSSTAPPTACTTSPPPPSTAPPTSTTPSSSGSGTGAGSPSSPAPVTDSSSSSLTGTAIPPATETSPAPTTPGGSALRLSVPSVRLCAAAVPLAFIILMV